MRVPARAGVSRTWLCVLIAAAGASVIRAGEPYPRAGYRAVFTEPGFHDAVGAATIVDERTIQIEHFTYDGTAPAVYFYLGATDTQVDFVNGIPIGPHLTAAYDDASLLVQLPAGQTLDGYAAISVWCVAASANFASATFVAPYARADGTADLSMPGLHQVSGTAIILDERTIHVEHFNYDGLAPLVYFNLAARNTPADLNNGIQIGPVLSGAYVDESVTVQLPPGETLDGYGALSVWCAVFHINFGSGSFPHVAADFDIDGDVDADDLARMRDCTTGPALGPPAAGCEDADLDGDLDIDQGDFGRFQRCLSGADVPVDLDCAG